MHVFHGGDDPYQLLYHCLEFRAHLTVGNYYGRGAIRRRELYESASILGIDQDHVKIIDDRRIPDGPDITWPQDVVAKHISEVVEQHGIQTVSGTPPPPLPPSIDP